MPPKPARPEPTEKVTDYDDGDPYSCIAAGRREEDLQRALRQKVQECFGEPPEKLQHWADSDLASVKTALYDIWNEARETPATADMARWAAERMAHYGDPSLQEYDRAGF